MGWRLRPQPDVDADAKIRHACQCPHDATTLERASGFNAERQTAVTSANFGEIRKDVEHLSILERFVVRANDAKDALGVAESDRAEVLNRIERVGDTQIDALHRPVETRLANGDCGIGAGFAQQRAAIALPWIPSRLRNSQTIGRQRTVGPLVFRMVAGNDRANNLLDDGADRHGRRQRFQNVGEKILKKFLRLITHHRCVI